MILGLANSLFRLFRENSDVVPVSRLKKQGVRTVTVLDWKRIEDLIDRAVKEALARRGVDLSPEALRSVNQEAREAFARLVEQRDTYRESARTLEAEKEDLLANLKRLREEIDSSTGALAREKGQSLSVEDVHVDERSMAEYERRLAEEVKLLLQREASGEAGGQRSASSTAESITALARRLLDEERDKALGIARSEQRLRIQQLERRIGKLTQTLADTESMVERLRTADETEQGKESIYREVQGLDADDKRAQEKRGLLEEIFKLNMELREVIKSVESAGGQKPDASPD